VKQTADLLVQNCLELLQDCYEPRELKNVIYLFLEDKYGISRTDIILKKEFTIDAVDYRNGIHRLKAMEPVQYVTGKAHFFNRTFLVTPDVLIPRPETEELVQWILEENEIPAPEIWDIGTGSGCIAISLAAGLPNSNVTATDISEQSLAVAKENSQLAGIDINFIQEDIFSESVLANSFDIIVSNPPYIPTTDEEEMTSNVLDYEPHEALFVLNDNPIFFYEKIAELGTHRLNRQGYLYFEIHEDYGNEVVAMLAKLGYIDIIIKRDLQGKHRMVRATRLD
jgi:release factor glutamine methyltransferase